MTIWLVLGIVITITCWLTAMFGLENEGSDKERAQTILVLIFWPIGLVVLIVMGFWKLFKTAFGKEEN